MRPDRPSPGAARLRVGARALFLAAVVLGCGDDGSGDEATTQSTTTTTAPAPELTFYRPSTVLSGGSAGDVLASEPVPIDPSWPGTGERITYASTTPAGDLVPVTGMALRPLVDPPPGGYPVVVWGHGTVGLGDPCAPSRHEPFQAAGAKEFLEAGYLVMAPDYEGLGVEGETHPYLVGAATGENLIDAVRAGTAFGGSRRAVVFGGSQGGHATLFSRELAPAQSDDVEVLGVVAAAPVTDPATFLLPGVTDPEIFPFTAEAILAWSEVYEEPELTDLVVVEDAENVRLAREEWCTGDISPTEPLDEIFLDDPRNDAVWRALVEENAPSGERLGIPVMLTHGDADPLVPISGTIDLHEAFCASGEDVVFLRDPAWGHAGAWTFPLPEIVNWVGDRFADQPPPTDCP